MYARHRDKIPKHWLAPGEQHDAVEALELLVDTVSDELKPHYKQESPASPFQDVLVPSDRRHIDQAASGSASLSVISGNWQSHVARELRVSSCAGFRCGKPMRQVL